MKPILFNTDMVRAILDGRKTCTRRVVKFKHGQNPKWTGYIPDGPVLYGSNNIPAAKAPYSPGDILYARETWRVRNVYGDFKYGNRTAEIEFKAGGEYAYMRVQEDAINERRWRPSIHMPKEAARLFLRVTDVRVEHLQDITEEQARAEGAMPFCLSVDSEDTPDSERTWHEVGPALPDFIRIWDSTINPAALNQYGWDANPWVWVIQFQQFSKEEEPG